MQIFQDRMSALHIAAKYGTEEVVRKLMDKKLDLKKAAKVSCFSLEVARFDPGGSGGIGGFDFLLW